MFASRFRTTFISLLVAGLGVIAAAPLATAAPADLDPTFAGKGYFYDRFGPDDYGDGTQVLAQPDGKILIAGEYYQSFSSGNTDQMLARYNPDGSRDTTFGSNGVVFTDYVTGSSDVTHDIALMADGRIVTVGVAGENATNSHSTITRYLPSGALDTSFSGDGKLVVTPNGSATYDNPARVAVRADGKILVAGSVRIGADDDLWAQRFNVDGTPDSSFQSGNPAKRNITDATTGSQDYTTGLVQHADGSFVLLAGYAASSSDTSVRNAVLLGFTASGSNDVTFGNAGTAGRRLLAAGSAKGNPKELVEQPDGKLVILYGATPGDAPDHDLLIRWDGRATALDPTFGTGGIASFSGDDRLGSFKRLSDGSFLLVGDALGVGNSDNLFLKVTPGGGLDPSFGSGGRFSLETGVSGEGLEDVAVQPDGKFVGLGIASGIGSGSLRRSALLIRVMGNYVLPPPPVALSAKIKSPSKSKLKASKLKSISGTAVGDGLAKVRLAVQRLDPKLLKKKKRCLYVTGAKGKTKKIKAGKKKKCAPKKYLTAKGTTSWSYKIKLKPGKYKLTVQAVGTGGVVSKSATKTFTLTK